jgi:hypothetical protein
VVERCCKGINKKVFLIQFKQAPKASIYSKKAKNAVTSGTDDEIEDNEGDDSSEEVLKHVTFPAFFRVRDVKTALVVDSAAFVFFLPSLEYARILVNSRRLSSRLFLRRWKCDLYRHPSIKEALSRQRTAGREYIVF